MYRVYALEMTGMSRKWISYHPSFKKARHFGKAIKNLREIWKDVSLNYLHFKIRKTYIPEIPSYMRWIYRK